MDEGLAKNQPSRSKGLQEKLMALPSGQSETPATEDMAMLSFMVSAVYQGVDIAVRYPTFYGKLQANQRLQEHFLDALDLMEHAKAGTLAPLPGPPRRDLSFLHKAKTKPTIEQNSKQEWRITWKQTIRQMQHLLSKPEMVYRGEDDWYGSGWVSLLRDHVKIGDLNLEIILETTVNEEGNYAPSLTVVPLDENASLPPLNASLSWGDYQEKVVMDTRGRATFPPLPLTNIYDPLDNLIKADLQLSLESTATPAI